MMKIVRIITLSLFVVPNLTATVTELYSANDVKNSVYDATLPVIVDVYKTNCNPCQRLMPIFTQTSDSYTGKAQFVKVNVSSEARNSFNHIMSVPTLIFYYQGVEKGRITGFRSATDLKQQIDTWLASISN